MAIKRGSKVETSFGAASMTDLMFLLLLFLMMATTLINSNALQILLPQGKNQVDDKPTTTITVTSDLKYMLDGAPVAFEEVETRLQAKFQGVEKPVVMVNMDKRVAVEEFAKLMNIAKRNKYSLFMMTTP